MLWLSLFNRWGCWGTLMSGSLSEVTAGSWLKALGSRIYYMHHVLFCLFKVLDHACNEGDLVKQNWYYCYIIRICRESWLLHRTFQKRVLDKPNLNLSAGSYLRKIHFNQFQGYKRHERWFYTKLKKKRTVFSLFSTSLHLHNAQLT